MDTVYRLEGSRVITGPMAGGPWDPKMQHGSAPSALIVAVVEAVPTAAPMRVARLTVDLMRPIPVAPLDIRTEVLREGRKIQLCNVDLISDGKLAVRGTVLRIRRESYELPDTVTSEPVTLPPPAAGHVAKGKITENPFMACLGMSVVKGGFNTPGPGAIWFRVERPIIEGQPISAGDAGRYCRRFLQWHLVGARFSLLDLHQRRSFGQPGARPGRRLGPAGRRDVARARRQRYRLRQARRRSRVFWTRGAKHPDRAAGTLNPDALLAPGRAASLQSPYGKKSWYSPLEKRRRARQITLRNPPEGIG